MPWYFRRWRHLRDERVAYFHFLRGKGYITLFLFIHNDHCVKDVQDKTYCFLHCDLVDLLLLFSSWIPFLHHPWARYGAMKSDSVSVVRNFVSSSDFESCPCKCFRLRAHLRKKKVIQSRRLIWRRWAKQTGVSRNYFRRRKKAEHCHCVLWPRKILNQFSGT